MGVLVVTHDTIPPRNRSGRGQVGPCLTDKAHRPLPERRSCVSRYASARTLQKRSLRRILQVESSYLLCQRPTKLLAHVKGVSRYPICQGTVCYYGRGRFRTGSGPEELELADLIAALRPALYHHQLLGNNLSHNQTIKSKSFTLPPATAILVAALNPNRRLLLLAVNGTAPAAFKFGSAPASAIDGITLGAASVSGGQGGSLLLSEDTETIQTLTPVDAIYAYSALGTTVTVSEGVVAAFL